MKLSDYVGAAADDYVKETGRDGLDGRWIAAFFQESGVADEYPRQGLVAFSELVQKELTRRSERAIKQARFRLDTISRAGRPRKA